MSRMKQVIDALEAERDDVKDRLDWLEGQLKAFRDRAGDALPSVPSRSHSPSTARRPPPPRPSAPQPPPARPPRQQPPKELAQPAGRHRLADRRLPGQASQQHR